MSSISANTAAIAAGGGSGGSTDLTSISFAINQNISKIATNSAGVFANSGRIATNSNMVSNVIEEVSVNS